VGTYGGSGVGTNGKGSSSRAVDSVVVDVHMGSSGGDAPPRGTARL